MRLSCRTPNDWISRRSLGEGSISQGPLGRSLIAFGLATMGLLTTVCVGLAATGLLAPVSGIARGDTAVRSSWKQRTPTIVQIDCPRFTALPNGLRVIIVRNFTLAPVVALPPSTI